MTNVVYAELKQLLKLGLPLVAAFLSQKGMQVIDTLMMGWIGPHALAAGAMGTGSFITLLIFCMGLLSAVGVFVARSIGENKLDDVADTLQHGLYLALMLALPAMTLLWLSPLFLSKLGIGSDIVVYTQQLVRGLVWGFPPLLGFLALREFVSAFNFPRVIMYITLAAIPATFVANYILIYGKWGFPALGIAGIGYAGAIIEWLMLLALLIYIKNKSQLNFYFSQVGFNTFSWQKLIAMIRVGVPSGTIFLLDVSAVFTAGIMMGYFGAVPLAAHQIALQTASVAFTIPFALSMATALRVSHAVGEVNFARARLVTHLGLGLGVALVLIVAVLFIVFAYWIIDQFISPTVPNYAEVRAIAHVLLIIAAAFQCFDAVQTIVNGALRGLKDAAIPMVLSILCYWILGMGAAYLLAFHFHLGAYGVWYGLTFGLFSAAIILSFRLSYRLRHEGRVLTKLA